ncbi:MAG: Hpt domain-containing protein [Terracidiphilus sp.]
MEADVALDDEILAQLVNDSREHLNTIEADLLAIGKGGANFDVELVNRVLRTAHTIKGTSAFFGLIKVKELAHKAETVLDMIRSKRMIPNAEIANLLLAAFDRLREMINHPRESADADIDELVRSLTGSISSHLSQDQKASLTQTVSLIPQWGTPVMLSTFDYERVLDSGRSLYSVEYDMIHDIERRGLNAHDVFHSLMRSGEILDCEVNFKAVGTLDEPIGNRLPMRLIFATALKPGEIGPLFPYNREKVKQLTRPALTLPLVIFE